MKVNKEIVKRVEAIYKWLDEQIAAHQEAAGVCDACGKCCDFESFGHRLFVTTPEILYFKCAVCHSDRSDAKRREAEESIKTDSSTRSDKSGLARNDNYGRCCYQVENKCTVYDYRFAGCRIFCCKGDVRFQSDLTEAVIKKFKALCDEFKIPYRYVDLPTALTTDYTKLLAESRFGGTDFTDL
jgi:hypothetical protein